MKMTDPWAGEAPSNIGSFLIWQQPHYIYFAEEMYRVNPSVETLNKYGELVEATAEFMADFVNYDKKTGRYHLKGATAMQESMSKDFSYDHPFELAYWQYGLSIAKVPTETFAENSRSDHPAVLGACSMLPSEDTIYTLLYNKEKMKQTLDEVMQNWNWQSTWGWDYGMIAMCAARLGNPKIALQALLIDTQKNTYLKNGHNYQTTDRLRCYLPGNGALLSAVAMMCAGWEGCQEPLNPGFPKDGQWNVRWEGLQRMQ